MADESKDLAPVKTQLGLNVDHYAKVYMEARRAAAENLGDKATEEERLNMTESLFYQFCEDQVELAKEDRKNRDLKKMLQPLLAMLERRGLYM